MAGFAICEWLDLSQNRPAPRRASEHFAYIATEFATERGGTTGDRNTSRTTADQKVETNWYLRRWRATIRDAPQRIRKPLLYPAELRDRALAGWISELRRVGYCRHAAPRPLRRGRDRGTSTPSRCGCGRPGTTSAATIRAIPRNQSYVGWAKASGTADRFMRAVRAPWSDCVGQNRAAPRVVTSAVPGDFARPTMSAI